MNLSGERDTFGAGDARGSARDVFDGDLKVGDIVIHDGFQLGQNVLAISSKFVLFTVKSLVMGITPGGASSGARAFVAIPSSALANAFLAVSLEASPRRVSHVSVLAAAFFDEDAFSLPVTNVIVRTFASWIAIVRLGAYQFLLQSSALGFTVLVETFGEFLVRFALGKRGTRPMGSDTHTLLRKPIFVLLDVLFTLGEVFAVIIASALLHLHAPTFRVLHHPVGTGASFGAHLLAPFRSNGNFPTRVLAVVYALFEHLACGAFDLAVWNVFPPVTDVVASSPAVVSVTPEIVAGALHPLLFVLAETVIGETILVVRVHVDGTVAFLKNAALQDVARGFGRRQLWILANWGIWRFSVTIFHSPFVTECACACFNVARRSQEVVSRILVESSAKAFCFFVHESCWDDNLEGHRAVPLNRDAEV